MAQSFLAAYFFPGPELERKRKRIAAIRDAITSNDGEEPECHRFYPYDTDCSNIISILRNGSLFSSRRLVTLADAHALKSADLKFFIEYINSPSPESVLIFTSDYAPGSREYPRTLANALPKTAVEVFWEMFERDKRSWVMHFFREKGLRIDESGLKLLLDVTDGTANALREACERLCFSGSKDQIIGEDDVDKALEHSRDETVYSLFDRLCRRDLPGVLDAYRKMIQADPSGIDRIPTMLADPLIRLYDFKSQISHGVPAESAARKVELRGGKRALQSYSIGANCYSEMELQEAIRLLVDLEAWLRVAPRELRIPKLELWLSKFSAGKIV